MQTTEDQLNTLFHAIPDVVIFKDAAGRWLKVNQAGKTILQLQDSRYKGKKTAEITELAPLFSKDPLFSEQSDLVVWEKQETMVFEHRIDLPDQPEIVAEITKIPVFYSKVSKEGRKGMLVIARDVTEQKRIERDMQLAVKGYQHIKDGVMITDEHAYILSVNSAFTKVTGYLPEEVVGQKPSIVGSNFHEKEFFNNMWQTVREQGYWQGEIWNRRKNGEFYCEHLTLNAIKNDKGKITNYIGIFTDITEQVKLRRDLIKTGEIQRKLLPPALRDDRFEIQTMFQPKRYVSGDFYDYYITEDKQRLTGFIMDFMGHGLSTAIQSSAVRVLFHQMVHFDTPLHKRVEWLNNESLKYFSDDTFAAALFYEFDLRQMTLSVTAAGINYFLGQTKEIEALRKVQGTFLGVLENTAFEQLTLSIHPGDYFLFLSDGFLDAVTADFMEQHAGFADALQGLQQLLPVQSKKDDCSAVCLLLK